PAFRLPAAFAALHPPESGIIAASPAVAAFLRLARERGAEVREEEPARAIHRGPDGIVVETDRGRYEADRLIVAAGPWLGGLLPELALPLRVTRQPVAYYRPKGDPAPFRP